LSGGRRATIVTALAAMAAWLAPMGAAALTVRLLGADGHPLAGARVRLLDVPGMAVADARGEATLLPDPQPPFTLLVTRSDGVALRPVEVAALPGAEVLELHLEASFTEAVTVLSTSAPDLEVPPAGAFTLLGGGDLGERTPPTLAAALEAVPGTGANGNGLAAVPALRGLASGRTLILLDEGRVASERRAGPSATFLDPATVEEIEVLRGPGSVAYGSDAFGGVIRARTRIPSPGDEPAARWAFTAGEGAGERAAAADVGARLAGGGLLLGANLRRFDDYESPRGRVRDSGGTLAGLRVGWQRAVAGGNLRLLWRGDRARDVGKPVGEVSDTRTAYPEEDSDRFSASFERPGPGSWSRLATSLFWGRSSLITERDRAAGAAGPREVARSEVAADDWGARIEAERPLGPGRLVVGADLSGRTGLRAVNRTFTYGDCCAPNEVVEVSVADAHRDDVGAFVAVDRLVAGVLVSAGLRTDRVRAENRAGWFGDRASSHTAGSGFVAASASLGRGFDASLQVARGFRDALLSDRYYRGVTGRGFITGNPDLAPERSRQLDAALARGRGQPCRVRLPLPHRRPHRALQERRGLLLPQPRRGRAARGRDRGRAPRRAGSDAGARARGGARHGRRRGIAARRHPAPGPAPHAARRRGALGLVVRPRGSGRPRRPPGPDRTHRARLCRARGWGRRRAGGRRRGGARGPQPPRPDLPRLGRRRHPARPRPDDLAHPARNAVVAAVHAHSRGWRRTSSRRASSLPGAGRLS